MNKHLQDMTDAFHGENVKHDTVEARAAAFAKGVAQNTRDMIASAKKDHLTLDQVFALAESGAAHLDASSAEIGHAISTRAK